MILRFVEKDADLAPQCAGLYAESLGLSAVYQDDHEMLRQGLVVHDALYRVDAGPPVWFSGAYIGMNTGQQARAALVLALLSSPAYALRPFEGTDASVADPEAVELEFGYFSRLQEGNRRSFNAPQFVLNLGLQGQSELVMEGRTRIQPDPPPNTPRTRFENAAISLKHVHREGALQGKAGPSVASECGALLPSLPGERLGATCGAIVSQSWAGTAAHLNAALSKNREGQWENFFGLIVAAPEIGRVRPVFETFHVRDTTGGRTESILAGVLWSVNESWTLDLAVRKAKIDGLSVSEVRAGFTWTGRVHH